MVEPRASDFNGSVCTCPSYTRPQLVHLSVRYSNPARIGTTLWTVGRAWHLGQRGRPSEAVDATGSDGASQPMSPIGHPPRRGQPVRASLVPLIEGTEGPERRWADARYDQMPQERLLWIPISSSGRLYARTRCTAQPPIADITSAR
jgi:hypothetical protein